nr:phage portal protein [Rubellimicrobium arenae]
MVEACVSAYAETAAMCQGDHWRKLENGGRERVTTSALARILLQPNDYQSWSDLVLNLVWQLYGEGEAFALALRNNRAEISELHLMRTAECRALVAEDGSIFYDLCGNEIIERRLMAAGLDGALVVPARDVLHVRLKTPRHPLKGESPIMAAALDVAAHNVALQQQIAFFTNRSRPSFVLTTDEKLNPEQTRDLRARWEEQSQGLNEGGTPVLAWGVKPHPIGSSAADAQLSETMKMSEENIALAFRVPLQLFGKGAGQVGSTETLMNMWLSSGLGFCLNHIEQAFDRLFGLKGAPYEYLELNTSILLRSNFRERIEGLSRGVISGIYAPDEARDSEDLPAVKGGHGVMPRVQQQVVPLDWHDKQPAPTPTPTPQLPAPGAEPDEEPDEDAERNSPDAIFRRLHDPDTLVH